MNVILAFSAMSFELQIIEYAEIIFRIIIFKTLNRKKNHWSKLKMLHTFPDIRKFCDTQKPPDIQYFSAKLTPGYTVFQC